MREGAHPYLPYPHPESSDRPGSGEILDTALCQTTSHQREWKKDLQLIPAIL